MDDEVAVRREQTPEHERPHLVEHTPEVWRVSAEGPVIGLDASSDVPAVCDLQYLIVVPDPKLARAVVRVARGRRQTMAAEVKMDDRVAVARRHPPEERAHCAGAHRVRCGDPDWQVPDLDRKPRQQGAGGPSEAVGRAWRERRELFGPLLRRSVCGDGPFETVRRHVRFHPLERRVCLCRFAVTRQPELAQRASLRRTRPEHLARIRDRVLNRHLGVGIEQLEPGQRLLVAPGFDLGEDLEPRQRVLSG